MQARRQQVSAVQGKPRVTDGISLPTQSTTDPKETAMRRNVLFVIAMFLLFTVGAYSQSSSSSSQSSTSDNSTQSGSSSSSNTGDATQTSSTTTTGNLQGCIIRQETDYFVQPVSGSRVRLNGGDQDLSKYVGEDVRLSGRWNPYDQNNENSAQASSQPSGAPITGEIATGKQTDSGNGKDNAGRVFVVARVDKISDTCPMNTKGNTSNPQ